MKGNVTSRVAASLLKKLAVFSLWFFGIGGAVMLAVGFILMRVSPDWEGFRLTTAHGVVLGEFCPLVTLISGIVYPLVYLRMYLSAGVTRRQFAGGFMLAGCAYSVALAALYSLATAACGVFVLESAVWALAASVLALCAGWAAAMGFQIRVHLVHGTIGILCAIAIRLGAELLGAALGLEIMGVAMLALGLAAVSGAALLAASRRVTVKC